MSPSYNSYKLTIAETMLDWQDFLDNAVIQDIFQAPQWVAASQAKGFGKAIYFGLQPERTAEKLIFAIAHENSSKIGKYLLIEHGPIFTQTLLKSQSGENGEPNLVTNWGEINFIDNNARALADVFVKEVIKYARAQNYFAVIWEPLATKESDLHKILQDNGLNITKRFNLPDYPIYIDLTKSETELNSALEKNTRYNIRSASKKGVRIEFSDIDTADQTRNLALLNEVYPLFLAGAREKGHPLPSQKFFATCLRNQGGDLKIFLVIAKFENQIVSCNFTLFYKNWCGSLYTENLRKFGKLHASYLLKWQTIMKAQTLGAKVFDMWGIVPNVAANHPEYGYSQFKLGFAPTQKEFVGAAILPLNPTRYRNWEILRKLRRKFSFLSR